MRHSRTLLLPVALAAIALAGCRTTRDVGTLSQTTKYTIENTNKFLPLDDATQASVTCTGLQEKYLPDGRLEVVANVKNRFDRPNRVQIDCVFKDEEGASTGDETPYRTLTLGRHETKAVTFISSTNLARQYTIQVRQPD